MKKNKNGNGGGRQSPKTITLCSLLDQCGKVSLTDCRGAGCITYRPRIRNLPFRIDDDGEVVDADGELVLGTMFNPDREAEFRAFVASVNAASAPS